MKIKKNKTNKTTLLIRLILIKETLVIFIIKWKLFCSILLLKGKHTITLFRSV